MKFLSVKRYYPVFFVLMFFLPYVGGRGRIEIVVAYLLLIFILFKKITMFSYEKKIFFVFFSYSFYTLIIILLNFTGDLLRTLIVFTNENMLFLGIVIYLYLKEFLVKNIQKILLSFLYISILVNLIAVFQFINPNHPFNSIIFSLYGGTLSEGYTGIGEIVINSNAEFLVKLAHRMTSIFTGMQFLAIYDLMVFIFAIIYLNIFKTINYFLFITIILLSFVGGILSVSKSYYFGVVLLIVLVMILSLLKGKMTKNTMKFTMYIFLIFITFSFIYIPDILQFLSDNPVIESFFKKLINFDMEATVRSRYSNTGHLTATIEMIYNDINLFTFGTGANLKKYIFGDSLYISRVLVSGILGLTLFLLGIFVLNKYNYKKFNGVSGILLIVLNIDLLFIGIGIPTYSMARLTMLLIILNLTLLNYEYRQKISKGK